MSAKLARLETVVGHQFNDPALLERAVTHRSWASEQLAGESDETIRSAQNESMEFLGDSVLGLVIAEHLYVAHPEDDEGGLTLMKHYLVSTATLAKLADEIDLGSFLRVGKGEEKTGGRKKMALLANTLEAVIAAVFLDGGYSAARVFVTRIFAEELKNADPRRLVDYKTLLQELLQSRKLSAPTYNVVDTVGPPHERIFSVEAVWKGGKTHGTGNSIKAAEMMAAEAAFKQLESGKAEKPKRRSPA